MFETQVFGGRVVDLSNPKVEDVSIHNIAKALSKACRFNGNTRYNYTVAQHSVMVADNMPRGWGMYGLLHDAHEAFIGDISTPVKNLINSSAGRDVISEISNAWDKVIYEAVGLEPPTDLINHYIKSADTDALQYEAENLMWECDYWEYHPDEEFDVWDEDKAFEWFMNRFKKFEQELFWV